MLEQYGDDESMHGQRDDDGASVDELDEVCAFRRCQCPPNVVSMSVIGVVRHKSLLCIGSSKRAA